ncbi:SGNH/GDSL hydrolase family protein [Dyadobacter psychrotolerans]|uniref:SGNH/GDSL hydrolase family protein n=1 Tax=Dyadobacter psychrotolerans TaxID=2541721 RepID=A0A4R5DXP7_9BACT|nr:SGNH/GDSL hydrolase family protein [Dyadobacter psychrotolerans]TDE17250.1 SGNH/GDSL hydrolase family protein [Dyadobacter psychrotolerans]
MTFLLKHSIFKILFFFVPTAFLLTGCSETSQPVAPVMPDSCQIFTVKGNFYIACESIKSLPAPVFSAASGTFSYSTKISVVTDSIPVGTIVEISRDNGKTWNETNEITLTDSGEVWARNRFYQLISPVNKGRFSIYYQRVLVVGNSITAHGRAPDVGWNGDWGMAASAADSDYLHLITRKLQSKYSKVDIRVLNGVGFENNYWNYDFKQVTPYTEFKPDLIIMRISENVNADYLYMFESRYDQLITTLTSGSAPKVICTTSFFPNKEDVSRLVKNVASNKGYQVVDLEPLTKDKTYAAYNFFADKGVGSHPSDKGMQAIADLISKAF